MRKILFFMLLLGVLFVGKIVNADTYTNIFVPDWTYNNNSLTVLQNYGGILGTNRVIKSPQTISFSSNVSFLREPYMARFRVIFDANTYIKTDVTYSNCNSEYGYCFTANMNSDTTPISLSFSMNQEGLVTYCSVASGGEVGGFVVDCPISHKTKPITNLIVEVVGGDLTGFVAIFGIGRTVTFIYPDSEKIIASIDSLKNDMNTKLQTINSSLGTINGTIGGLPQAIYNKFDNILTEIKNNSNTNTQKQIDNANKNSQNEINATNKNTQATKDQTDYLKDNTAPTSDISALGNVTGVFPPGPLDSLLNIPFEFLSVLTSSFSGTCVPMETTWVFGKNLTIPCFSDMFWSKVPIALMTFLDVIPAVFILIQYFKRLYKKVDRAMSMETNSDDEWGVI